MPAPTRAKVDDDDADLVKVSPPTSSDSLLSYHTDNISIRSRSESGSDRPSSFSSSEMSSSDQSALDSSQHSSFSTEHGNGIKSENEHAHDHGTSPVHAKAPGPAPAPTNADQGTKIKPDVEVLKDVQGVIEDTVQRVRQQSDRFQLAAQPYADKTRSFAERRPILFTFLALWAAFSAVPILLFFGFVLAATVVIASTAVFAVALTVIGAALLGASVLVCTILFGVTILLPCLFITTLLASGALATLLATFLAHRLYLHISAASEAGGLTVPTLVTATNTWVDETLQRLPLPFSVPKLYTPPAVPTVAAEVVVPPKDGDNLGWNEKWSVDEKSSLKKPGQGHGDGGGNSTPRNESRPFPVSVLSEKEGLRYESKPTPRLDVWPVAPHPHAHGQELTK